MSTDLMLRCERVLIDDAPRPAALRIRGGRVAAIEPIDAPGQGARVVDLRREDPTATLLAGVVDAHVHINEPGQRTEWEGFVTATSAAAAGGTTTVVDMPLNCTPVTTTRAALMQKARAADGRCLVDYAFWGGVVPGNEGELEGLLEAGAPGCKCFLVHSGIDDFPQVGETDLRLAMPILAAHGAVLLVHAELPGPIDAATAQIERENADPRRYSTFLRSRPRESEDDAIALMIRLSRETGCRVHIVHLSSADALPSIAAAKRDGVPLTVETCPHYLTFAAEDVPDGATFLKCCPPIREKGNRERLWEGLRDGTIDQVVSDHSPCTPALKHPESGDFLGAWGGIAGLQFGLAAVWTEARARGFGLADVSRWMSRRPAHLARLSDRKGTIAVGRDADLVAFRPDEAFTVSAESVRHRHAVSPYVGRALHGVVGRTWLRSEEVFAAGVRSPAPGGRWQRPGRGEPPA
ncbi:MAG: allantoinase AllB [Polyangiales bacterium]